MAKPLVILSLLLCLTAIVLPIAYAIPQSPDAVEHWVDSLDQLKQKITKLHFYCHESLNPKKDLSAVVVVKDPVFSKKPPNFGILMITDDPLTLGPNISSKRVGYSQGLHATSSLEEVNLFMGMTFFFTDGLYNGSTLVVLGSNPTAERYRELPIVGGSGIFGLARGIVTLQTYFFNATASVAILEVNVVALHY